MSSIRTKILNDGTVIPVLGFGTGTAHYKQECSDALVLALNKGFRYIDTAAGYGNERSIDIALKKWGGKREDVFICSKWGYSDTQKEFDPEVELQRTLEQTGLEYLDLYLMHLPNIPPLSNIEAWRKMEDFKKRGLVRSIGVSHFRGEHIEELASIWTIRPSVNQVRALFPLLPQADIPYIEYHPYCFHDPRMIHMAEVCAKYDIAISPFSSLCPLRYFGGGPVDEVVQHIGEANDLSMSQVLLAWARQRTADGPVVTGASKEWQYGQILDSAGVQLSEEELRRIDQAGRDGGVKSRYTLPGWDSAEKGELSPP